MTKITMLVVTATVLAAGCGGDGGSGGTDAVTADQAEDLCRDGCEHDFECDPIGQTVEECTTSCLDDVVGVIREDVFIDVTACFLELECGVSDDICLQVCEPTASHQAYETACRASLAQCDLDAASIEATCEVSPSPTSDDIAYFCLIAPSIVDELTACFDADGCQAQSQCLEAVLDANGLDS